MEVIVGVALLLEADLADEEGVLIVGVLLAPLVGVTTPPDFAKFDLHTCIHPGVWLFFREHAGAARTRETKSAKESK